MKMNLFRKAILILSLFLGLGLFFQNCAQTAFSNATDSQSSLCKSISSPDVQPKLLYSWNYLTATEPTYKQVMSAPVVGDLDGDRLPEIVFVSYMGVNYTTDGILRVLNGKDGTAKFSVSDDGLRPLATTTPLLIDLDGDGKVEIIYTHYSRTKMIALNFDGSFRWKLDYNIDTPAAPLILGDVLFQGLAAADLEGNGKAIILGAGIKVTEDQNRIPHIQQSFSQSQCPTFAASLDPGKKSALNLINCDGVYDKGGLLRWHFRHVGQPAVADLIPEIPGIEVVVSGSNFISIYNGISGEVILDKALTEHTNLMCPSGDIGGGQATIGDFDGDPSNLEIAIATGKSLTIFNKKGDILAGSLTTDCSSLRTGITSFDFNGDGKPEIIYADEEYVRIYEMDNTKELKVIWSALNPSGTLYEYPVVADVDGSGEAKLLVVSNNSLARVDSPEHDASLKITGLRVFGPTLKKSWMPTRSIWNQYSYFVTNVQDSLQASAATLTDGFMGNSFKRNVQKAKFENSCK